jgi:hypothetical protein
MRARTVPETAGLRQPLSDHERLLLLHVDAPAGRAFGRRTYLHDDDADGITSKTGRDLVRKRQPLKSIHIARRT